MTRSTDNVWLRRFAWVTAGATLVLIGFGGLVTSHGAGMAVPDWPNTYGYNLFFFPISRWVGGIFYEHTHRLVAAGVGLLTTILAGWLWLKEARRPLRWLGLLAWFGVVFQGVLGGLRVTLYKDQLGIFHALVAQLFLVLVVMIALQTTRWWQAWAVRPAVPAAVRHGFWLGTLLVLVQLGLGATMRHQHAGLSIPDFPLAYGRLWPRTDPAAILHYNQQRIEVEGYNPITAFQVELQMVHRLVAVAILAAVLLAARRARAQLGPTHLLSRLGWAWVGFVLAQIGLGAATIWTGKSADVATAHVVVGALTLVVGAVSGFTAGHAGRAPAREASTDRPQVVATSACAGLPVG